MTALAIRRFSRKGPIMASLARSCLNLGACLVVVILCVPANALDPNRHISQYGHTVWRVQDGAIDPAGEITQTADGYLWLGTSNGLLRFGGVKFVPFASPGLNFSHSWLYISLRCWRRQPMDWNETRSKPVERRQAAGLHQIR